MKSLVLAGGFPQIDLIKKLKDHNIEIVLADYNEAPVAKIYADKYYQESTLDVDVIKRIAIDEDVDFLITICTDQALLTVAKVSEELGLPCYIDFQTALNVTNKEKMKQILFDNAIPTTNYVIAESFDELDISKLAYPLIVKPVDCNSSKGVKKVNNNKELITAFNYAVELSRTKTAIVEEFFDGKELSVDVYVESGFVNILDITTSEKLKMDDKYIIFRTWHPAKISQIIKQKIQLISQQIASAFNIKNSPMLIQLLTNNKDIDVIEISARTGGGVKHLSIKERTGIDIVSAVIDLTLGKNPKLTIEKSNFQYMVDEYIYCNQGVFDHLEGFKELKDSGIISDYYLFKPRNTTIDSISNSGDRICGFSITGNSFKEMKTKHNLVNEKVKVISTEGIDIMRHDLIADFNPCNA